MDDQQARQQFLDRLRYQWESATNTNFDREVHRRLIEGERQYQNQSYSLSFSRLQHEMLQECADLGGWPFILWHKCQKMLAEPGRTSAIERQTLTEVMEACELVGKRALTLWIFLEDIFRKVPCHPDILFSDDDGS